MKKLIYLCVLFVTTVYCYAQANFPFGPVDTVTSGDYDDTEPIIIDGGMYSYSQPLLLFIRNNDDYSEIVGKKLIVTDNDLHWNSTNILLSQMQPPASQRKPAGATTSFGRGVGTVYFSIVAWEMQKESVWNIFYSVNFNNDSSWSSPQALTDDTVDNTDIKIQAWRDSTFILSWKRKSALIYSFLNPSFITLPETAAISNSDSFRFDMYSDYSQGFFVWTSNDVYEKSSMSALAFDNYPIFTLSVPKTLPFQYNAYNPRTIHPFYSSSILFETDFEGNREVWMMDDIFYGNSTSENISNDSSAEDCNPRLFISPMITKRNIEEKSSFWPYNSVLVMEKYSTKDTSLYFAQGLYYFDTAKSIGYNRNACIGSEFHYFSNYLHVPVVWESNRSGRSHIYSRFVSLLIDDVKEEPGHISSYVLDNNYPNPFNPSTTIRFVLPISSHVLLKIFDIIGREVATLVNEDMSAGEHLIQWNASEFTSGIYFYRIQAENYSAVKKMVLMK